MTDTGYSGAEIGPRIWKKRRKFRMTELMPKSEKDRLPKGVPKFKELPKHEFRAKVAEILTVAEK